MNLKLILGTTTAIGVLMAASVALADSNLSALKQNGNDNNALILQNGTGNQAGASQYVSGYFANQTGDDNTLSIDQTGNSNVISNDDYHWPAPDGGTKLLQSGNWNQASLTQNSAGYGGNIVGGVYQYNTGNQLTVKQYGENWAGASFNNESVENFIGETYQNGGANLKITQDEIVYATNPITNYGNPGFQVGNSVMLVKQAGAGDSGVISQTGDLNFIGNVEQLNGTNDKANLTQNGNGNLISSVTQIGSGDQATVDLEGNYNGDDGLHLGPGLSSGNGYGQAFEASLFTGAAADVPVTEGAISQTGGNGNILSYRAIGSNNSYGFVQTGGWNTIDGVVTGSGNQAAVAENGSSNYVSFTQSSDDNNVGINILGNSNNYRNYFTGDARQIGLTPGNVNQGGGTGNSVSLTVGGLSDSNSNLFAFNQSGSDNIIVGSISGGNGNQVAVSQNGSSNSYTFSQVGSGNNIGVSQ